MKLHYLLVYLCCTVIANKSLKHHALQVYNTDCFSSISSLRIQLYLWIIKLLIISILCSSSPLGSASLFVKIWKFIFLRLHIAIRLPQKILSEDSFLNQQILHDNSIIDLSEAQACNKNGQKLENIQKQSQGVKQLRLDYRRSRILASISSNQATDKEERLWLHMVSASKHDEISFGSLNQTINDFTLMAIHSEHIQTFERQLQSVKCYLEKTMSRYNLERQTVFADKFRSEQYQNDER